MQIIWHNSFMKEHLFGAQVIGMTRKGERPNEIRITMNDLRYNHFKSIDHMNDYINELLQVNKNVTIKIIP